MLALDEVQTRCGYGLQRGYLEFEKDGRYAVTWAWYRADHAFLERRHSDRHG